MDELDITWDEFVYWQAYLTIEHPEEGDNQRTAALLAQITNMSGKSMRDGKSVTADDFLGRKKETPVQSMEEQIRVFKAMDNK